MALKKNDGILPDCSEISPAGEHINELKSLTTWVSPTRKIKHILKEYKESG
jgi:hypothetical protein